MNRVYQYHPDIDIDWPELHRMNIEKLQAIMKRDGIKALIINSIDNYRYITGVRTYYEPCSYDRQGAILTVDADEPVILCRSWHMGWIKKYHFFSKHLIPVPGVEYTYPSIYVNAFKEVGISEGKVALDPSTTYGIGTALQKEFPKVEFVDAYNFLREARMVKNKWEIKVMRMACAIADCAMTEVLDAVKAGRNCKELQAIAEKAAIVAGSEQSGYAVSVASGPEAELDCSYTRSHIIRPGELVSIDLGPIYGGMVSDMQRTVCAGRANELQKQIYKLTYEIQLATQKAIKPGAKSTEVDSMARNMVRDAGFGDYLPPYVTCHGVGWKANEDPYLGDPGAVEEIELEPGMIIAAEPHVKKPGIGGLVYIENTCLVTDDGCEPLTTSDYVWEYLD